MNNQEMAELLALSDEELYGHYSEGEPEMASDEVRNTYENLNDVLEAYIVAVSENSFAKGFRYAVLLMKGNTVA